MAANPLFIPVIVACLVVLVILALGIANFAKGGVDSSKRSNKLMQWRLAAQFGAVILILAFVTLGRK